MYASTRVFWSRVSLSCALLCMVGACDFAKESASNKESVGNAVQKVISDELHSHGTRGFIFLPPLVPPPADYGGFMPNLPVTVRIDELTGRGTTLRTLATFTTDSGPEGERLRIHYQGSPADVVDDDGDSDANEYYYARWFTNDANLTSAARYRLRVLVPGKSGQPRELGYADVDVVTTRREFRSVNRNEFVPLLNGRTLRIKFRVDWPAVDQDHDGIYNWLDNCVSVANPDQTDSLGNGVGDACRCARVSCPPQDSCHIRGECQPATGTCTAPLAPDGTACPMSHADASCVGGLCQLIACNPGHVDCNFCISDGCEANTNTTENCGACGIACVDGENSKATCRAGQCALLCSRGYADCDGDPSTGCEQEIANDPNNCGSCGIVCQNQEGCLRGGCTNRVCAGNYADCDRSEANGCEQNVGEDVNNCGTCGRICSFRNATAECVGGDCAIAACGEGHEDCNGRAHDGCEKDLLSDLRNCGGCNNVCAPANAIPICAEGVCAIVACAAGYVDCDGQVDNGCEAILASDPTNCGTCGNACVASNATPQCNGGSCEVGTCNGGYGDCNGLMPDGCEAQLATDGANCGACDNACRGGANAAPSCIEGGCGLSCNQGFADCDNDPSNGCERDVTGNCGVCGNICPLPHALGECTNGACSFSVCESGYADCDGVATNGCEVNLGVDQAHCGGCGSSCTVPNMSSSCVDGACVYGGCQTTRFADCDGEVSNGCEVDTIFSLNNCGSCGKVCQTGRFCSGGICRCPGSCPGDGTGACPDLSEPNQCGSCLNKCVGGEKCVNGNCTCGDDHWACGMRGSMLYSCCPKANSICRTGSCWYFDIMTDPSNCGSIGHVCASGLSCSGGVCADFLLDPTNCGYAGNQCPEFAICFNGVCRYWSDENCGGPGIICPTGSQCMMGLCHCDGPIYSLPCNGVCNDFLTDPNNCGRCGLVCPEGAACSLGQCIN